MKTLVASGLSLVLGLVIGWYVEHRRAEYEKTEIVEQMAQGIESSDAVEAARDARAIGLIDSGDTQEAVRLLSTPVVHYYSLYAATGSNDTRSKVRALIEQLATTNQAVAALIAEAAKERVRAP